MAKILQKFTKKRLLVIGGGIAAACLVFAVAVWAINDSYIKTLQSGLNTTKNNTKKELQDVSRSLHAKDPANPEDVKNAIAALESHKKDLNKQLRPVADKITPFLIKTQEFQQAADEFSKYEASIRGTVNALDSLILSATYQVRAADALSPVFGNAASANAVDAAKQATAWQQALDDIKKLSPDTASKFHHGTIQAAMQDIIAGTNEVAAAQAKKDPQAFGAAVDKLNKSYESLHTAAEALRAVLKDKQTKLAQSAKTLF